jgi:hypothetical protein
MQPRYAVSNDRESWASLRAVVRRSIATSSAESGNANPAVTDGQPIEVGVKKALAFPPPGGEPEVAEAGRQLRAMEPQV